MGRTEKGPDLAREKGRALICYCRMWMQEVKEMKASG